jgi:hypothetical protein
LRIEGTTAAIEGAEAWVVSYLVELDAAWATRSARITASTVAGTHETFLESDGAGHWLVDGSNAPYLDGCMDVDLESSAMTNALPVHRMNLRIGDQDARQQYEYSAPAFGFTSQLRYDDSGLVVDYPGIAMRAG